MFTDQTPKNEIVILLLIFFFKITNEVGVGGGLSVYTSKNPHFPQQSIWHHFFPVLSPQPPQPIFILSSIYLGA